MFFLSINSKNIENWAQEKLIIIFLKCPTEILQKILVGMLLVKGVFLKSIT